VTVPGFAEVVRAWDEAGPARIHPAREHLNETAYWISGCTDAKALAKVLPAGCDVLDFGCGDGRIAIPLAQNGYRVTGADSSPRMLAAFATRAPALPAVCSDGTGLREALGRQVDAVVCIAVLIHYGWAAGAVIMAGLADAVRPGGLLVAGWPTGPHPHEEGWIGVTTWDAARRSAVAARCGLEPVNAALPWPVWRKRDEP
jgi:SAM-dependent methyltransferase